MNTVKKLIDYIRITTVPLVLQLGDVTFTLTASNKKKLTINSDHVGSGDHQLICTPDECILTVVLFMSQCTIAGRDKFGKYISECDAIMEHITKITQLPDNYDRNAKWLVELYEQGNKQPLVNRVVEIVGDVYGERTGELEDDTIVYQYYREHCDAESLKKAYDSAYALRIYMSRMSVAHRVKS